MGIVYCIIEKKLVLFVEVSHNSEPTFQRRFVMVQVYMNGTLYLKETAWQSDWTYKHNNDHSVLQFYGMASFFIQTKIMDLMI